MAAANDNSPSKRYVAGAGNIEWVPPDFDNLTKDEEATLARPLSKFHTMVLEAASLVTALKSPGANYTVYVISDIHGRISKIGKSADPLARLAQLQTGNPRRLYLHRVFWMSAENADYAEREAHRVAAIKHDRMEGEWFRCTPSDAHKVVEGVISANFSYCAMTPREPLWRAA
ncbi:GIY-YIG nuclease family protein [Rhizobium pusense]|uniref:GIY-YIG nuclease family protein n=1 Tax=Agrobacterium pusense TaxID=648995 RepID=A0A6H0ZLA0_9HYPH|nr:GIY-YIG nuclease family protein [Agrobacterium pusense]MDH2091109.1 GIY-YIG nuclease family protein [Agrobacterium pusense]QIX21429.1 GIY-YIG nuclease family protein [Agrobacterium pusense]